MLSIGLMSGTSMDGIDAALLETDGHSKIKELGNTTIDYQPSYKLLLKSAEYAIRKHQGDLAKASLHYPRALKEYLTNTLRITDFDARIQTLATYLYGEENKNAVIGLADIIEHSTYLHYQAVKKLLTKTNYETSQIDVVGYHGQTMFHKPAARITIQVGDGQLLADELGITVINNFRQQDVAAGGQGAPFAPLYHHALARRDNKIPVMVVNCGGIANLTLINSENELDVIGFDTGPGNGLVDSLIRQRTKGEQVMDADGQFGKAGKVNSEVFAALYEKSILSNGKKYFDIAPPKSLDYGDLTLIPELTSESLTLNDACRTLEAFTADTIVKSLDLLKGEIPSHWILAGGGWKNPVIRQELEERLRAKLGPQVFIQTADEAGWNSQALEAQIFAYLAVRSLKKLPISVPGTTQIKEPLTGGEMHIAKHKLEIRV